VATADLVVLGLASTAPPPAPAVFYVSNAHAVTRTLRHADGFNTLYLELRFPPAGLSSLDGQPLTLDDSVLVTVEPLDGGYGFTLSPSGLVFTLGAVPTALFSFARYADPSVADGIFPDRQTYLAALDIWSETSPGRWTVARASGSAGADEISAAVDAPGRHWLAARVP
jgi:hypothetical protein